MEDSECFSVYENKELIGFYIGYYKEFDDLRAYYLEEIVIFSDFQNKGYGTAVLQEMEKRAIEKGAEHIELISVNDEHHEHFYNKLGYYEAKNLVMMGKHFKQI